jgi:hypothetical protein
LFNKVILDPASSDNFKTKFINKLLKNGWFDNVQKMGYEMKNSGRYREATLIQNLIEKYHEDLIQNYKEQL